MQSLSCLAENYHGACTSWGSKTNHGVISDWNTSLVTDMSGWGTERIKALGSYRQMEGEWHTNFNGDISNWDTSQVTNMYYMFRGCILFNRNIGNWDTSQVTDMRLMFYSC